MAHALTANTITFPIIARLRSTIEDFRAARALRREYDAHCAAASSWLIRMAPR